MPIRFAALPKIACDYAFYASIPSIADTLLDVYSPYYIAFINTIDYLIVINYNRKVGEIADIDREFVYTL